MSDHSEEQEHEQHEVHQPRLNDVATKFIADLQAERQTLENFPLSASIIDDTIDRVFATGRIPGKEYYADVYKQKPIKITQKVFVPIKQYPKFNFVGKILGPKGNSLRRLEDETQCRITIKGRNSMRDRGKEEELRNSSDPRYSHLHKDLYVEISTVASPAESYARVAYALAEIRKYLVPDKNDEVSHDQLREMMEIDPSAAKIKTNGTSAYFAKYGGSRKYSDGGPGNSRYIHMIRTGAYTHDPYKESHRQEEDEDCYPSTTRVVKRPIASTYDYAKAKPMPSAASTAYKRLKAPLFESKIKRLRETPTKAYKPNTYGK